MKALFAILAVLSVAACNTTTQNTNGSAFGSAASPVTYAQPAQASPPSQTSVEPAAFTTTRAPGWYQTPGGLPWAVIQSSTYRKTGRVATDVQSIDTALRYQSSGWRPPYAKRLDTEHGSAQARLVTVDSTMTYLVMNRLRVREVFKVLLYTREPYEKLMEASIRQSGCAKVGNTVMRSEGGAVFALAAKVSC